MNRIEKDKFFLLDVETTGLSPLYNSLYEFAGSYIKVKNYVENKISYTEFEILEYKEFFLPIEGGVKNINRHINRLKKENIIIKFDEKKYEEEIKKINLKEYIDLITNILKNSIILGYNVRFDLSFVIKSIYEYALINFKKKEIKYFDVLELIRATKLSSRNRLDDISNLIINNQLPFSKKIKKIKKQRDLEGHSGKLDIELTALVFSSIATIYKNEDMFIKIREKLEILDNFTIVKTNISKIKYIHDILK